MTEARPTHGTTYTIRHGKAEIPITVLFGERKTLKIVVHPDLWVVVSAPVGQPLDAVLAKVQRRAHWILRQRRYFEQYQPRAPEKRYVSGETFYYLGRQYRLKVAEGEPRSVKLVGRFLTVLTPNKADNRTVCTQVQQWYKTHALAAFEGRLDACLVVAQRYGMASPQITLRRMTRRWGSSSGKGHILLNTDLVTAPVHCVDYVIIHELCHQKHRNHTPDFYQLLSRCQPDWEARKERLERVTI